MQLQPIFIKTRFSLLAVMLVILWSGTSAIAQDKSKPEAKGAKKATATAKILDGKSFPGKIGEKGKTEGFGDDEIIFKGN